MQAVVLRQNSRRCDFSSDAELMAGWLFGKAAKTTREYVRDVRDFFDIVGAKSFDEISLPDLQTYYSALEDEGLASNSLARKLNAVRSLLTYGHRYNYLTDNVGARFPIGRVRDTLNQRLLTEEEVGMLFSAVRTDFELALLATLFYSGVRAEESTAFRVRDLAFSKEGVTISIFGKGSKTRNVNCCSYLADVLAPYVADMRPGDLVFPVTPRHVHRVVSAIAARTSVGKPVSPHWLRHAFATLSLEAGCPPNVLQQSMGHEDFRTTQRYLNVRPTDGASRYLPGVKIPEVKPKRRRAA